MNNTSKTPSVTENFTKPDHLGKVKSGEQLLEIKDLSVDFGVDDQWIPAVKKASFTVNAGQVLALVGQSGSGKSTTAMAVLDLLPSNSRVTGQVLLDGQELLTMSDSQMRPLRGPEIAVIFQEPMTALDPVYTIGSQIIETLRLHTNLTPQQAKGRTLEMLKMVELADPERAFKSYPHQLSGGQRQRAMIAQSLSLNPKLLVADEPTTALDVTVQAEILELLRNLKDKLCSGIILITHDMGVVADLGDDVAVMRSGEIVEQGSVQQIFNDPREEYTKELIGAVPRLGDKSRLSMTPSEQKDRKSIEIRAGSDTVLDLQHVGVEYGKRGRQGTFKAVEDISFSIEAGKITGLVGESGSGKSTIGRAAVGLLPISEGSLTVNGLEMLDRKGKALEEVYRNVGMVFQDPASSLNPRMTIGQSITEPLKLQGVNKDVQQARLEELLDRVRLSADYQNRFPHELSGGQKQRVGIARALVLSPTLLVADEPTSALDVTVQALVLDLFQEIQQEMQFACLFITHDLAVVEKMSDNLVVLQRGKIAEQGPTGQVLDKPQEEYTRRLLSAVPVPDPEDQRARRISHSNHGTKDFS